MTKEQFRISLEKTYGNRPFYFRREPECQQIRGQKPGTMANVDALHGLKPFYVGKKAAYSTEALIEYALTRFSEVA